MGNHGNTIRTVRVSAVRIISGVEVAGSVKAVATSHRHTSPCRPVIERYFQSELRHISASRARLVFDIKAQWEGRARLGTGVGVDCARSAHDDEGQRFWLSRGTRFFEDPGGVELSAKHRPWHTTSRCNAQCVGAGIRWDQEKAET